MTKTFKAIQAIQIQDDLDIDLRDIGEESLSEGNVTVDISYSTINY